MSDDYEELQKKQLFAQRVTAVSSVASAVAAHQAAASLEAMRQDANVVAVATMEHQTKMQEMQEAQLSVIEKQAQAEAKDREYQRQVLFLKESDDTTKLETYFEMAKSKLLDLYILPDEVDIPEECRDNGSLKLKLKSLTASSPEYTKQPLPERAIKLQDEIPKIKTEILSAEMNLNKSQIGFWGFLGIAIGVILICAGISGVMDGKIFEPAQGEDDKAGSIFAGIFALLVCFGGGGWLFFAQISKLLRSTKKPAIEKQLGILKEKHAGLETELKPFVDEVNNVNNLAKKEADEKHYKTIMEYAERWQSLAFTAMIKHYFDQGLWIESDGFKQRLKTVLTEVQKPFPTSCRVDASKLQPNQIAAAYQIFTKAVAHRMCAQDIMPTGSAAAREVKILEILRREPSAQTKPNVG